MLEIFFVVRQVEKMKLVFVILHYTRADITAEGVKHILDNCDVDRDQYRIIIVDNLSPDGSLNELKKEFGSNDTVIILENEKNMGFSGGNNVGFMYAKQNLDPDFIVVQNNDAYLKDSQLYEKLMTEYNTSHFWVGGPKIESPDGDETNNPMFTYLIDEGFCDFMIRRKKADIFWSRIRMYDLLQFFRRVMSKLKLGKWPETKSLLPEGMVKEEAHLKKLYKVGLHGSCWFFSREYIKRYDGLDQRTFMYSEEMILFLHMYYEGGIMVYMPEISFLHLGKIATGEQMGRDRKGEMKRRLFEFEHSLVGWEACKSIIEEKSV